MHLLGDYAIVEALRLGEIEADLNTGEIRNKHGKILKGTTHNLGYRQIALKNPFTPGNRVFVYTHRVVYIAKCIANNEEIPSGEYQIDHINGIKSDNRAENLRAVTARENARNPNTLCTGAKNPNTKITDQQKQQLYEMHKAGNSYTEIIEKMQLPICKQRASQICLEFRRKENAVTN